MEKAVREKNTELKKAFGNNTICGRFPNKGLEDGPIKISSAAISLIFFLLTIVFDILGLRLIPDFSLFFIILGILCGAVSFFFGILANIENDENGTSMAMAIPGLILGIAVIFIVLGILLWG